MKALVCDEPGSFSYVTKEQPVPQKDHAIIKIRRIGICGTDLHAYEGTQPYFEYPRILGHELSGVLEDTGGAEGFEIGDRVTFIPYFNCGHCIACRNGLTNCCVSMKVCGVHVDGGMAEYLSVPVSSLLHGKGLNLDELATVEPMAIGAHGVRRAGLQAGETMLVIGAGPIGLGVMEFGRILCAEVIAMDVNDSRLQFCKDRVKVQHTINPLREDVMARLKEITNGDMPTVVIDATGNIKAINDSFHYIAHGGRYVLIGLQKGHISFNHPEFHKREATLMSSRNATRQDFEFVMDSMKKALLDTSPYITHSVEFDEVKDQFDSWLKPSTGVIKAMIDVG